MNVALMHCEVADREHAQSRRQYAHTFHHPHTVCVAEAFWRLPKAHRDGIILHEMGHLLAGSAASEDAANEAVEEKSGARVEYVDSRYGPALELAEGDVRPRVTFDSVSGRGSAGLPVAVRNPRLNITDRALRYRANEEPPDGPRVCCYCGSTDYVEIDHVNGFEEDTEPDNLVWACRSCNTLKGIAFRNAGRGRRTAQFNPTKSGGAATVGEWIRAVGSIIPHKGAQYSGANYGLVEAMPVGEAVAMIRATPGYKRSEYAGQLRKHRGSGRRRAAEEVPF